MVAIKQKNTIMRKTFYLLIALFVHIVLMANDSESSKKYFFDTYIQKIDTKDVKEHSKHDLGEDIAKKLTVLENIFITRYDTKIGLSDSEIEIQKPDLLESVEKIDKHFKKKVKKKELNKNDATKELSRLLDIAYTLFYEESNEIETVLSKIKKAEDIVLLYNNLQFLDNQITANN